MSPAGSGPERAARRATVLIGVAAVAAFTANLDLSIVNLALATIGHAFSVGQSTLAWTVSAYVLPYAISILAVGRLGDAHGHRRVLAAGSLLFALGSLVAAVAPAYVVLLVGRVLQGFGGSALMTIGLAIVSANFSGGERARGLGIYFAAGATAAVVGPLAGGLLTAAFGWRGIFVSQLPLALVVFVAAVRVLPDRPPGARRSLDLPGLAAGTVVLVGLNVALLQANAWGWTSPPILGAWLLALVGLAGFVARERRAAEPAVRLDVFRSRVFVASALVGAAAWFGILSGTIQLAIYLQDVRGLTTTEAALVLTPWPLAAGLLFPRSGAIVARIGPERTMVGSLVLALVAAWLMVSFDRSTPLPVISLVAALGGVPIALGVTASTVCALAEFTPTEAGVASGVFNALRQIGSSLGVAIPAAVFDLTAGPATAAGGLNGSIWALASRGVVFAIALGLVAFILPRGHAVAGRLATQAVPVETDD
jgi:DHA2 family methylenomycin A resistance protein-like MFS transporter